MNRSVQRKPQVCLKYQLKILFLDSQLVLGHLTLKVKNNLRDKCHLLKTNCCSKINGFLLDFFLLCLSTLFFVCFLFHSVLFMCNLYNFLLYRLGQINLLYRLTLLYMLKVFQETYILIIVISSAICHMISILHISPPNVKAVLEMQGILLLETQPANFSVGE